MPGYPTMIIQWIRIYRMKTSISIYTLHYNLYPQTLAQYTKLNYPLLRCTTLHYTKLHLTMLHYDTLNYAVLHYTTCHCTIQN